MFLFAEALDFIYMHVLLGEAQTAEGMVQAGSIQRNCVKLCHLFLSEYISFDSRMTILPSVELLKVFLDKFKDFHLKFLEKYK